jgi:hypothetical protein
MQGRRGGRSGASSSSSTRASEVLGLPLEDRGAGGADL